MAAQEGAQATAALPETEATQAMGAPQATAGAAMPGAMSAARGRAVSGVCPEVLDKLATAAPEGRKAERVRAATEGRGAWVGRAMA